MKKLLLLILLIPCLLAAQRSVMVKLPVFDTTRLNSFLPLTAGPLFPLTGNLFITHPGVTAVGDTALRITTQMTDATAGANSNGLNIGLNIGNASNTIYSSYKGIDILAPVIDPSWTGYISDYAAITIEDMGALSVDNTRYGINQKGANDNNYFGGYSVFGNGIIMSNTSRSILSTGYIESEHGFINNSYPTLSTYTSVFSNTQNPLFIRDHIAIDDVFNPYTSYSNISSELMFDNTTNADVTFLNDGYSKSEAISGENIYSNFYNYHGNPASIKAYATINGAGFNGNIDTISMIQTGYPMAYRLTSPNYAGTVSDVIGLMVNDISLSNLDAQFTNKYGIYQAGVGDSVVFNGLMRANVITATSLKKTGGTSSQIMAADGSNITAGTNITISGGTISATGGVGTVTSVATNTGSGITGGTITGSGTIAADTTTVLLTKARGIANLIGYAKYADTSSMLSHYYNKTYVDANFLNLNGGALTGAVTSSSDLTVTGILSTTLIPGAFNSQFKSNGLTYFYENGAVSGQSNYTELTVDSNSFKFRNSTLTGLTNFVYSKAYAVNRSYTLPAISGTLALTSDIPSGFTYTTNYIPFGQGTTTPNQSANLTYNGTALSAPQHLATQTTSGSSNQGAFAYGTLGYSDINHILTMQGNQNSYIQMEIQNTNTGAAASSDVIVTNNNGTATTFYGDFGMNSSGWVGSGSFNTANTVYVTATSGDLALGTTTSNAIHLVVNGGATDAVTVSATGTVTIPNLSTAGIVTNSAAGLLTTTNGTGFIKNNGSGVISYDNSTYQPLATNLTSIGGLANTAGVLRNNGSGTFSYDNTVLTSSTGVTTFSAGTTGFTPSSGTSGAITLSGTLIAANGGTGFATYAVGDLLSANTTTTLSKIADVSAGQPLLSGGVSTLPAYAGYTFSGTAAQTYTFPTATSTLASNTGSNWTISGQAIGDIPVASSTTAYGKLADVAVGSYLRSGGVGVAPLWSTLILPNAATVGDLMLASSTNTITSLADIASGAPLISGGVGVVPAYAAYKFTGTSAQTYTFPTTTKTIAANDGSNLTITGQAIGDIPVASSTTAYGKLADVAVGSALISGGVGVAPSWGIVPIAAGGTNATSAAAAIANLGAMAANTTATVLTPGTTVTWTPVAGVNQYTLTPAQAETINMGTVPAAMVGQEVYLEVNTSGTTTFALTFGTNIKSATGVLNTGAVSAKLFVIAYLIQSTTNVVELYRTVAQ